MFSRQGRENISAVDSGDVPLNFAIFCVFRLLNGYEFIEGIELVNPSKYAFGSACNQHQNISLAQHCFQRIFPFFNSR